MVVVETELDVLDAEGNPVIIVYPVWPKDMLITSTGG
jgi:hypothetical protein